MTPKCGASFSENRRYRYLLWRTWEEGKGHVMFIGLNPSTADETEDDPTIRRCIAFAKAWGYGGITMMNLFAYRATDPLQLMRAYAVASGKGQASYYAVVGERNDDHLATYTRGAEKIVAAWGARGEFLARASDVTELLEAEGGGLWCLGLTKGLQPRHPLYVPGDKALEQFH